MTKYSRGRELIYQKSVLDVRTGCWNWPTKAKKARHIRIKIDGKTVLAHRFSYEVHKGKIPKGKEILHKCHNAYCVRPSHLFIAKEKDHEVHD